TTRLFSKISIRFLWVNRRISARCLLTPICRPAWLIARRHHLAGNARARYDRQQNPRIGRHPQQSKNDNSPVVLQPAAGRGEGNPVPPRPAIFTHPGADLARDAEALHRRHYQHVRLIAPAVIKPARPAVTPPAVQYRRPGCRRYSPPAVSAAVAAVA